MPLPGRLVIAGTLVLNYGAKNMAPTQKNEPLLSSNKRPHIQILVYKRIWNEQKFGNGVPDRARNQEWLCWRVQSRILLDLESLNGWSRITSCGMCSGWSDSVAGFSSSFVDLLSNISSSLLRTHLSIPPWPGSTLSHPRRCKFEASSLTQNLAGYRVRNYFYVRICLT
jgi:hypothetical protein